MIRNRLVAVVVFSWMGALWGSPDVLMSLPWIGDGEPAREGAAFYADDPAPEFRAEFVLPEGVVSADVTMACAGYYAIRLNGHPAGVSGTSLMPLWSPFDHKVYADTFTARTDDGRLKPFPEKNVVTVTLGNGFYNLPPLRFWGAICFRENLAHGRPCFKLAVGGMDAPLSWSWRRTNILKNCVYLGTEVDSTKPECADWRPAVAVSGPRGKVVQRLAPPVVYKDKVVGKVVRQVGGTYIIDFGSNLSGVPSFVFAGQSRGDRIEVVYGERLDAEGMVNPLTQTAGQIKWAGCGGPGAPVVACQRDAYVCSGGGEETFEPPFTWHVCRYAEVRGAKTAPLGELRTVMSDLVQTAASREFRSATSGDLTRLHEVCMRTFRSNLLGVQSDCPGRERLGYGGDIVATCEAMCLNFDMREFYLKTLQDFADEAADDGLITETAPFVGIAYAGGLEVCGASRAGPVSWALVVPVLMDVLIRHYPDVRNRALSFYPVCARYARLVDAVHPSGIVPKCIGDHEALERASDDLTATAHWHEFLRLTAGFAKMLGKDCEAYEFDALARKVAEAFQTNYVREGCVGNGSQSAQAIGLYLGLVPVGQVSAAERRLVEAIEEKDCAPHTGIFSTRYMLEYLSAHGYDALARKVVLHKGFPGWLHMLEHGATTLWETWKESDDVYSNCHPMFGSVDEWILKHGARLDHELKEGRVAVRVKRPTAPAPAADTAHIVKPLNIVNFARGSWPYDPDYDLTEVMRGQIALNRRHNLSSTILLEYSSLRNERVLAVAKTADPRKTAYGIWFEVDRYLADVVGIHWPGKDGWDWDWHTDSAMSFSYPIEVRARLVDESVRHFREKMGSDPQVFAAWMIDAWTMQYIAERYPCIEAFGICREQDSIDAYDLRGGYYGGGYYPSRRNALSAAREMKNAIRVPCFRIYSTCPIRTWGDMAQKYMVGGCPTNEAMWLLGYDPDGFDWMTKTFLAPVGALNFSQYLIGQENTWSWARIGKPWAHQMEVLARWRDEGRCKDETLVETARAFRRKFSENVPQTQVALEDWAGEGAQSVWYNSRFYRCNIYKEGSTVMIRDLHVMDDGFAEEYLRKPCRQTRALQTTLPVFDAFLAGGTLAKGCPVLDGEFAALDVATPDDRTLVVTATRLNGTKATITLAEGLVTICGARLSYDEKSGTRAFTWLISNEGLAFEFQGYHYGTKVIGEITRIGERSYRIEPEEGGIVFEF